ncbi:aspartyl protease family protein [Hymenobacter terricola]|uniref:aspartyl protease family protein n=1 Tax=Hymenobacter terricola TaxID=2819236 RepID=UPI001B308DF8|nr:aspartyl protease family protein [Hymenobacter terricola]
MRTLWSRRQEWKRLVIAPVLGLLGSLASATAQPVAPFHLLSPQQRQVSLPYQAQRNLIIISARLNGQGPYNFVLDTGVNMSLLLDTDLQSSLHLTPGRPYRVAGTGGGEAITAYQVDGVRVTLPGVEGPAISFLLLGPNGLNFSNYVGMPIHGILGADVFRSFVVRIDPVESRLVLFDPARFRAPTGRRWTALPLALNLGKPYLTTRVTTRDSATTTLRLLLDTGAGHSMSLDVDSNPALGFPVPSIRAPLGRGLSGDITGYLGRTATIELGRYSLHSLITSFPDTGRAPNQAFDGFRNGSLGYEALNRFVSVIDYPHNRLLLRPGPFYRHPFEQDMSGMEVEAVGADFRRYQITLVQADSPAAEAGLRVNDELLFINFIPVASLTLSQLGDQLRVAAGRRLTLVVRRADGELNSAVLALRRRL